MTGDLVPWIVLAVVVGGMLALDLLVLHRDAKSIPFRQAALWAAVWIGIALAFGAFLAVTQGAGAGGEYFAGYLIELSLSVDNLFVFALIFAAFAVPAAYQHRLLFWGILGAIVFRATFIFAGTAVLSAAHWVIYLLGVLLVVTGIRLARSRGHAVAPERNPALRLFRRLVPTTTDYRGAAFVVREGVRRMATPMLAALVVVETTDIMFALDSIPAVFAITIDPLIVFSSNLFAIVGLRSLYFLLAGLFDRFIYLKTGLAALLVFAGGKILAGAVHIEIPIALSLGVIVAILGTSIVASLVATHPRRGELVMPAIRVASGVSLGIGAAAVLLLAAAMDAATSLLVLEVLFVIAALVAVALGIVWLRRERARSPMVRVWVTLGTGALLVVAILMLLE